MRIARLIVFESDGRLAAALRPLAEARAWSLREPRRQETALRLLERGGPNLLLIRAGRDLEREFTLLARARERHPDAAVVLLCDGDHPRLQGLGWDLGATYVLTADQARGRLIELVEGLLKGEE
jgi:DNA-binding response OmpR family regulator